MKIHFFVLILFFYGCNSAFEYKHTFTNNQWKYQDSLSFTFDNQDVTSNYKIVLKTDFTEDFPFTNLYIKFRWIEPDGKTTEKLTNFVVAEPNGKWLLLKSWGTYSGEFVLNDNVKFEKKGKYQFGLTQYLREDVIQGIKNLKLQIIKK
jgi:gliding motility-associated lipoprotein GldH